LRHLLTTRFGALPDWAEEKLTGVSIEQLDGWAVRIFDAKSLEEFFK
jgi:hypothetical protein